jgi:2-keto-4-pentenoate hydratase/2-oxohepta-3-ene-1,7-dioic acid hydratase in catechol pathway
MKLVSIQADGRALAGVIVNDQVLDLAAAARRTGDPGDFSSMLAIVRAGALPAVRRLAAAPDSADLRPLAAVELLAPITPPRNVFCVGRNYVDHVKEGFVARDQEIKLPEAPQFFTKATHALNAPNGTVQVDARVTRRFDYEVELAVIIGQGGRDIPADRAFDHVLGYAVCNDFTARDLQRRHDQWFKGKSLDTSFPLGPWITDAEAAGDIKTLELSLTVNGELRQQARVAQMIFDVPTIIAALSAGLTLEAGDVIATGTPAGVGFAMSPPRYLAPGDVVVTGIDRLGTLTNRIVAG